MQKNQNYQKCKWFISIFFATFITNAADFGSFTITTPEGWNVKNDMPPIMVIAKSPESKTAKTIQGSIPFQENFVATSEPINPLQEKLFKKDPQFYMEVVLYGTYPTLKILESKQKEINGIKGAFFIGNVTDNLSIGNVQFYFVQSGKLYGAAFTCLENDLQKNIPVYLKYIETLKMK